MAGQGIYVKLIQERICKRETNLFFFYCDRLSSNDPVSACIHNAKVCRKHGRLDLYKVWYLAIEILRGCVPMKASEVERVITDGHQMLIDSIDTHIPVLDDDFQRDKKLAEVKQMLYSSGTNRNNSEMKKKQSSEPVVKRPLQRVKWGMHPLGQKLVDGL